MLRFAPSPTGDMHIGNLRVAIFNALLALKLDKKLILRIEDTDIARNIDSKDKEILDILKIFKINYDELIYQSSNFSTHLDLANKLLKEGKAFYCYCSKEFLEEKREQAKKDKKPFRYQNSWALKEQGSKSKSNIIRLNTLGDEIISFKDALKGEIKISQKEIDSFVIIRDEIPTYNFACAIDDAKMSFILRGEDHISNTPKQILVKKALGINTDILYAHLPIILNEDGKKMSKRDNHSSIKWLLSQGLSPEAIFKYLVMLGNSKLQEEDFFEDNILSLEKISKSFDIFKVSKTSPFFDYKKLLAINKDILRAKSVDEIFSYEVFTDLKLENKDLDEGFFKKMIALYRDEANSSLQIKQCLQQVLMPLSKKEQIAESSDLLEQFTKLIKVLKEQRLYIDFPSYEDFKSELSKRADLKGKDLFKPLRLALSGSLHGGDLALQYEALKKHLDYILQK